MHYLSLAIYIHTVNLASNGSRAYSEEHRDTPMRELRDAPTGGHCGETIELEGGEPTINAPAHLLRHPNGIHEKVQFWEEGRRNQVRRYDTTWRWGSSQLCISTKSTDRASETKSWERLSVYFHCMIRSDGNDVYLIQGMPNIYLPSLCPPQLPQYHRTHTVAPWRRTWRRGLSVFGDAFGGHDRANLGSVIVWVWRYTCRL